MSFHERVLLRGHLQACMLCSRRREQFARLGEPLPDFSLESGLPKLSAEAKARIKRALKDQVKASQQKK